MNASSRTLSPASCFSREDFEPCFEQGYVLVDLDGEVHVGDLGASTDDASYGLGIFEAHQSRLFEGVDDDDFCAFFLAFSREVSIRGWLVPGFWPKMRITSARSKSSSLTEPLPIPRVSLSATPLDSWHMLEQSGRLLVPNFRTKSWYRNAASLLVRPEV